MTDDTKNRPVNTLQDANLKASIWRNEGENGHYYTTSLTRRNKDAQGNYYESSNFAHNDLLKIAELARGAYSEINDLKREEFREKRQQASHSNEPRRNR